MQTRSATVNLAGVALLDAFAAFTSVLRTLARNGEQSLVEGISQVFRRAPVHVSSF